MTVNLCRNSWPNRDSPLCPKWIWLPRVFTVNISHVGLETAGIWEELPTMCLKHNRWYRLFSMSFAGAACTDGLDAGTWLCRTGARLVPCLYPKGYLAQSMTSDLQARRARVRPAGAAGWLVQPSCAAKGPVHYAQHEPFVQVPVNLPSWTGECSPSSEPFFSQFSWDSPWDWERTRLRLLLRAVDFFVDRVLSCHQCLRSVYSWPGFIFSERIGAAILALAISPLTLHVENNDHLSH